MSGGYTSDEAELDDSQHSCSYHPASICSIRYNDDCDPQYPSTNNTSDPRHSHRRGDGNNNHCDELVDQRKVSPGGGEWVEGPGWRMKTPVESRRRQVVRAQQASDEAERELRERKASRTYTTPGQGKMVAADDDGAVGAAPKDVHGLRAARMSSVRAKTQEQRKAREEADKREQERKDAPIQRKLQRARRAAEALEAKQQKEYRQQQEAMRSSWRQREINTTDPLLASSSTAPAADQHETERQQIEAAIRNSIADMTEQSKAPAVTTTPAASRRLLTESFPPDSAHLTDSGTAHGEGTMEYWDEVLDGPSGSAVSRGACNGFGGSDRFRHVSGGGTGGGMDPNVEYSNGDGWGARGSGGFCADEDGGLKKNEKDWNPVLAVALSVVELDATVEIPSEAAREGFSHTLLTLLKSVLEVDERRMRVRDSNEVFRENVGRWACGRRLMRLAGFVMQRAPETKHGVASGCGTGASSGAVVNADITADESTGRGLEYVWVARAPTSSGHVDMLKCLVGALEDQVMLRSMRVASRSRAAEMQGFRSPLPTDDVDPVREATEALETGARLSRSAEETEYARIRKEQDVEFQEALRRDREAATAVARATSTGDARQSSLDDHMSSASPVPASHDTPAAADPDIADADAGLTIGGGGGGQGMVDAHPDQTAAERRAMIAESYRHLGLES